jgi:hypothetical protein
MPVGVGANFLSEHAAATVLSLYFVGAVISHLRIKDKFAAFAPALVLAVISIATTVLINANLS